MKHISVHVASLRGKRPENEDCYDIIINSNNKNKSMNPIDLITIADGHGGKGISAFIKNNLPKFFMNKKVQYPLSKAYVEAVFEHIQATLKTQHPRQANTSGCTSLTVIHFKKDEKEYLNVINLGDSRCVICKNYLAIPGSLDHKPTNPIERYRITQAGGKIVFDGNEYRIGDLSLSRAFGDTEFEKYVSHVPDLNEFEITPDVSFVICACDGLYDVVENQEAVNFILEKCYDRSNNKRINKEINIAALLAQYAIKKKSYDNVTVIIMFFD